MKTQRFPFALSYWTGDRASATTLKAGEHFRFDLDALNRFCLVDLPCHLVDLLRIASAVYVVDRLVKRRRKGSPKTAARNIGLKVAVLKDTLWNQQDIRDVLHEALEFVTGDFWEIEFERETQPFHRHPRLFPDPYAGRAPLICMYSGGLDSAPGLAARLNEDPTRPVIPVTVWHQARQRHLVRQHCAFLRAQSRKKGITAQIDPLIVRVELMWKSAAEKRGQETSQRSRSFLFTALGAITAVMHGQRVVEMFESGIGAINLPLMAGMVGPKTTRNAHPKFLRLMSRLVTLLDPDTGVNVCLPFFDKTKGEMVRQLAECGLSKLAIRTASCVHYPRPGSQHEHCGICPGCIGRRQAMAVGGIAEPASTYERDFLGQADPLNQLHDDESDYLKAFLMQVERLRDIEIHGLSPAFERHIVPHIVPKGQSLKGVIQLLARYRNEWLDIVAIARERGHAWARLLAPKRPSTQGVIHASA